MEGVPLPTVPPRMPPRPGAWLHVQGLSERGSEENESWPLKETWASYVARPQGLSGVAGVGEVSFLPRWAHAAALELGPRWRAGV